MTKTNDQSFVEMRPIGVIRTDFRERFATPRQGHICPASRGSIEIFPGLQPRALTTDLASFSHLWILSWFHKNPPYAKNKIRPPRLLGRRVGVLASRSPLRPNPVGLTLVELDCVDREGRIHVKGVDLVDGTPILDVKPYIGSDRPRAFSEGWVAELQHQPLRVEWVDGLQKRLDEALPNPQESERVRCLIEQALADDPRPLTFKKWSAKGIEVDHGSQIAGFNVRFRFMRDGSVLIFAID
jgi:tRNA-Thr(GGU) m(6)t(6)A37 methyltransferase TsaA